MGMKTEKELKRSIKELKERLERLESALEEAEKPKKGEPAENKLKEEIKDMKVEK